MNREELIQWIYLTEKFIKLNEVQGETLEALIRCTTEGIKQIKELEDR